MDGLSMPSTLQEMRAEFKRQNVNSNLRLQRGLFMKESMCINKKHTVFSSRTMTIFRSQLMAEGG